FPNDLRVQEQIALTLVEEGQAALALPRFEALAAKTTKDLYRQSQFQIQVAEIKIRLGKTQEGLADFERLLDQLNPDNWLYRDVRHKIDEVFLRTDDQAGLATYYEGWVGKHAEDVDAMARLSRILATLGRAPEAQKWLEKGLKLAPSRKELRMAIIDQLVYDQKYPEAIQQYELLNQHEPNNPDTIRDWGRLILKDISRPEADRKLAATTLWKKLLEAKPTDPVVATQVADLFRHADLNDEALALYKKAVELAPDSAQYREYLGEYYHQLKRSNEALATWRQIAEGKNRTAPNLARLGEVLIGFGYLAEGTAALAEAVKLDPQGFDLQIRLAKALSQGGKYEDALQSLAQAEKLVTNAEESESVLQQQLLAFQASEKLPALIEALEKELAVPAADAAKQATRLYVLARYYEADRKLPEALRSALKSLELAPLSIPTLAATARIQEANNSLLDAAETNRRLAAADRRFRTQYLTQVAKLESRLGRRAEALKAGREVLASAPGSPDSYEFFAQLCFQLGENNEGLETLRRSVRVNPAEPKVVLALAAALAEQFKTPEAIDLYWRAFERSAEVEGKLDAITKLTELYLQTNHLDRMLDRLERERREDAQQQRVMTLCIAQTHQSAGDFGSARVELERMLTPETRDTPLLQQLAKLAEAEGDSQAAIKYQEQLNKLSPKKENLLQLAQYLSQAGETQQAAQLQLKVLLDEKDSDRLLKSIDMLLQRGQNEEVIQVTERLLRDQPRNWEYLYREGVALVTKHPERAEERFQQILALNLPDDELSEAGKAKLKQPAGQKPNMSSTSIPARLVRSFSNPLLARYFERSQAASMLRYSTGIDPRYGYSSMNFWAPDNFGNARLGALAWLQSAAQKKGQQDAFISARRTAWEQAKANSRLAWDWYYLQLLQTNPDGVYQAARALVALPAASTEAQFLFLNSLAGRGQSNSQRVVSRSAVAKPEDTTPALPPEELELVLRVYQRTLKDPGFQSIDSSSYGMNWLGSVGTELTRAKRGDEAKKLFEETRAAAKTPEQVAVLLMKAGRDGDFEQYMKLWDELDKLSSAEGAKGGIGRPSSLVPTLMAQRATAKAYPDILKLLDRAFASEFRERKAAVASGKPRKKGQSNNPYGPGQIPYYQIYGANNVVTHAQFNFPLPNSHFSHSEIQMLRNAFALYQSADLMSDLMQHFEVAAQRPETSPAERLPWQLSLAYLNWWNDSQDVAVEQLRSIAKSLPEDQEFQLELADLYATRNEFAECLELVDSLTPLDQEVMQRREKLALRMAMQLGETDRAREAASRLFGLRLDTETQVQLASQMKQLGMHEQAEAVMARAGRQAGNRLAALLSLMREYQSQGKPDIALQIAQTILRRTQAKQATVQRTQASVESEQARQQAIQFLVSSGKLKDLISRVESQLKNSPNSIQLHQTLAEFYTAVGDKDQARKITLKLAELNPNDPQARWQVAMQLLKAGETEKAVEHMRSALKQQPRLFANEYWEVQSAFQRAKKISELVKLLDEIDLKAIGQSHAVLNIVQNMLQESNNRAVGMKLFQRAWESFPNERAQMLAYIHQEEIWETPAMYTYARQAFIPQEGQALADPWSGFDVRNYSGNGDVSGGVSYLLRAAKKQNKLPELEQEITQAIEKHPTWRGGKAMQGIIRLQRGEQDVAVKSLEEILDNKEYAPSSQAAWLIGQELKSAAKGEALAVRFYQLASLDQNQNMQNEFQYRPEYTLVTLYSKTGQKDLARELLLKAAAKPSTENYNGAQYAAYQKLETQTKIAEQLQKIGYPIDALKIYSRLSEDRASLELAKPYGGGRYEELLKKGLETSLKSLRPENYAGSFHSFLQPAESLAKDPEASAVDLFLTQETTKAKSIRLTSLTASILEQAAKVPAVRTEISDSLAKLQVSRPDDVSVLIAASLLALHDPQPEALTKSVEQLDQWVTAHPLEVIAAEKRANSRQRAVAEHQIPLWLVARECLKREPLRAIGSRLGARATEAGRRQNEKASVLAIVKEQGQLAWDAGDKVAAEANWTEMLDLILVRPAAAPSPAAPRPIAVPVAAVPPPTVPAAKPANVTGGALPATLSQFTQVIDLAKFAATNELQELSFKAARMAFRGGAPVADPQPNTRSSPVFVGGPGGDTGASAVDLAVINGIGELQQLWSQHHASPDQAYELLLGIVFPTNRPEEIQLYARPLSQENKMEPRSVGLTLVKQAIVVHKESDLREKINVRLKSPVFGLQGQLLLAMLAVETKDIAQAKTALQAVTQQFELRPLQNSAELVCHVALPALDNDELAADAQPVLARAVKQLTAVTANNRNTNAAVNYGSLQLRLAGLSYQNGDAATGKTLLADYLTGQTAIYQNYGGDYGQFQQKQAIQRVAGVLAKAGQVDEALKRMAEVASFPKLEQYGTEEDPNAGAAILKQLEERPAAERYKLLKAWTLPAEGRKTLLMMDKFSAENETPNNFLKGLIKITGGRAAKKGLLSSAKLLVQTAQELGKLDELAAEVQPLVEQKVERAAELLTLIKITQKKAEEAAPAIKLMLQDAIEKQPRLGTRVVSPWPRFNVAIEALEDPALKLQGQDLARALLPYAHRSDNSQMTARLRHDLSRSLVSNFTGAKSVGGVDPGLKWWRSGTDETALQHAAGQIRPWWVAHAGVVSHICGPERQFLYFLYPVAGTFEFTVDAYCGGWAEGNVGYGGLELLGVENGSQSEITPHGLSETLHFPPIMRRAEQFNRHTIQVQPGSTRYLVNSMLVYEDKDPGQNAPWLALRVSLEQQSAFKNLTLTGQPEIPREVRLQAGDRLEGWLSNFYGETQPPQRSIGKPSPTRPQEIVTRNSDVNAYDWAASEGVIYGRHQESVNKLPRPSRLYYHRPLEDGDTLSYEFFYEPDSIHVHPTLDRLTFVLDPQGVRLHWMTDGVHDVEQKLPVDNVIDQPDDRRGPSPLPLLPGKWNSAKISLQGSVVRLELNGQLIYESTLDSENGRQFGFYHNRTATAVQVRNVILAGNWPQQLGPEILKDLLAERGETPTLADRQARRAIIGERFYNVSSEEFLFRSADTPPTERFAALKDWVLPNGDHLTIRLNGFFKAGELHAPAVELIALAKSRGQLNEVLELIEAFPANSDFDQRSKLAFQALAQMSQENWSEADRLLVELYGKLKVLGAGATVHERWPELLAGYEAARHPLTRFESRRIMDEVVAQSFRRKPSPEWDVMVRGMRDTGRLWQAEELTGKDSAAVKQWFPVTVTSARRRATGLPAGTWRHSPGEWKHFAGGTEDLVYFQLPLRGDFELECELSSFDWRELEVMYAGEWSGILGNLSQMRRGRAGGRLENTAVDQAIRNPGFMYDYRLVSKAGTVTQFINDVKISERTLAADSDPWLAVHSFDVNSGTVRNLRVTGSPTIPKEIDLLAVTNLPDAWRGDYFLADEMLWKMTGTEFTSEKRSDLNAKRSESLVQYHRPLFEDGELDYEFFYQPGEFAVHPALDRLVMLVEPSGVNVHWLTDGTFEASGLKPDNVTTEKENRRGPETLPLKAGDWNQAKLKLVGKTVTLFLN
ncbi:MAG: DUF1583 domain-containing protein, partial [Planctomycetota bacterium]